MFAQYYLSQQNVREAYDPLGSPWIFGPSACSLRELRALFTPPEPFWSLLVTLGPQTDRQRNQFLRSL